MNSEMIFDNTESVDLCSTQIRVSPFPVFLSVSLSQSNFLKSIIYFYSHTSESREWNTSIL